MTGTFASIRGADTTNRYGGDKFVIMLPLTDRVENATLMAIEIDGRPNEPYILCGHKIAMGDSLGMAIYPSMERRLIELLKKADTTMYCARSMGHTTRITIIATIEQPAI